MKNIILHECMLAIAGLGIILFRELPLWWHLLSLFLIVFGFKAYFEKWFINERGDLK